MTYNVFSGTLNPTHFTSLHFDQVLIAIMNLIAKLGIIYATACHASLCTAALDCLSVSCHCHRTQPILYTNTVRGEGGGD